MTIQRRTLVVDDDGLEQVRTPRDTAILLEHAIGPDSFALTEGPFAEYGRRLTVVSGPDHHRVEEEITWRLDIPLWWVLFWLPARRWFGSGMLKPKPWWAPAGRLDRRSGRVIGLLAIVAVVNGFLGTVIGQTLTFAADEFCTEFEVADGLRRCIDPDHDESARADVFSVVRIAILLSLSMAALADRLGRRRVLGVAVLTACAATAVGSVMPSLTTLTLTQIAARGLATGIGILLLVVATEELPARSRAYGVSLLVLAAGLGSGMVVWILPLADVAEWGWRLVYASAIVLVVPATWAAVRLPVSKRFAHMERLGARTSLRELASTRLLRNRLILLSISGLLAAVYSQPASQFHNQFLRDEQGFSATEISLFTVTTSTPIGIGVFVGGLLADRFGRRITAALGTLFGVSLTLASFFSSGVSLWTLTLLGVVLGAIAVPAVGVYGPELFPTRLRSTANGVIRATAVIGSVIGLQIVGRLVERWDDFGPAMAATAIGPLILVILFLIFYPETNELTLEAINREPELEEERA